MSVLGKIKSILRQNGFRLFTRPYELNIVGIRSASVIPNRFDDEIHVFYKTAGAVWHYHIYKVTTDPGTFWLRNPLLPQGTAILAQGQYVNAYEIGLHRGQYPALVQRKPVAVLRDYDRDATLDFFNGIKRNEFAGINIHRASSQGTTKFIDKYSAGCQVFENAGDFSEFMQFCERHRKLYGNMFTYTLIDFRAVRRETRKRFAIGTGIALSVLGYFFEELKTFITNQFKTANSYGKTPM
jgi:hypothetical protein